MYNNCIYRPTKEKENKKETPTSNEKEEKKESKGSVTATVEPAQKTEEKVEVKKDNPETDAKPEESEVSTAENMDLDDKE